MPNRFYGRDRALTVVRQFAGGDVRVETTPDIVIVVMAHGAVLPDDIVDAYDYAAQFTGGSDTLLEINGADDVTGDEDAIILLYPNRTGLAALVPVP